MRLEQLLAERARRQQGGGNDRLAALLAERERRNIGQTTGQPLTRAELPPHRPTVQPLTDRPQNNDALQSFARNMQGYGQNTGEMLRNDGNALAVPARAPSVPFDQPGIPEGSELIGTFADNGRVYREPNGRLGAVSAGGATRDPETIRRIMEGDSWAAITQSSFDSQRIDANPVLANVNEFARGVPFVGSWIDEATGLVSPERRDTLRAISGAMQRERPGRTAALNMAGAVATAIPAAAALGGQIAARAGATIGQRALQGLGYGALVGGTEGAIYGAGEGTDTASRVERAATGAGIGAAAGGALGAALPYVGAGLNNLIGRLRNSDVDTVMQTLGVGRPAAVVIRDAIQSGDQQAAEEAIRRAGPNAMLADAGMPAAQLLDASAQAGGAAGQIAQRAVRERTQEASRQVTQALDRALGRPQGQREIIDRIRNETAGVRSSAYDAAYAQPIDYASPEGRELESLLRRVPAYAWRKAQTIMMQDGDSSLQRIIEINGDQVTIRTMPDVRQIDLLTRALSDVASEQDGAGKIGGATNLGRSTTNLLNNIRNRVRSLVPEYETALQEGADAIRRREAVDLGYSLFSRNVRREDVARALHNSTGAEKMAAREGLRSYIDELTANVVRTIADPDTTTREGIRAMRDFSSRANQTKLRMLLGQDAADRLLEELDQAATAFELRAAIAENSKTAIRQGIQGGINQQAQQGIVRTLAAGEPVNATKRLVQAMTGETAEAMELRRLGIYQEIARALTEARGARAENALRIIQGAMNRQGQVTQRQAEVISQVLIGFYASNLRTQTAVPVYRGTAPAQRPQLR